MKKLLILLFLFPLTLSAQEKYFHQLNGLVDSAGTTHLFYRLFDKKITSCAWYDGNDYQSMKSIHTNNHIYHLNLETATDTVVAENYNGNSGFCEDFRVVSTSDLIFFEAHPDSFMLTETHSCCIDAIWTEVTDLKYRSFPNQSQNVFFDKSLDNFVFGYNQDPYGWNFSYTSKSLPKQDSLWFLNEEEQNYYREEYSDSVLIPFLIEGISSYDGTYIGIKEDTLAFSNNKGDSINRILTPFDNYMGYFFEFTSDSSLVYLIRDGNLSIINYEEDPVNSVEIYSTNSNLLIALDKSIGSHIYLADSSSVIVSEDYGNSFEFFLEMEYQITGLYKKPHTDILYVLTTDELYEVNTSTLSVTFLKKLPVSREPEPVETPTSAKLHQNYPNPFNPTTTISFELNQPSDVRLTIFDALGKTIAVLVDERQSAGLHEINFDASSLSSGIYFYLLETDGFTETKRLTLIK